MLDLDEFVVIKKEVNDYYYRYTVEAKDRPYMCTKCCWEELDLPIEDDNKGKRFTIHGNKMREVADIPIHGKPVTLVIKHIRYKCPCCGGTFYQPFLTIDRNGKVTKRPKRTKEMKFRIFKDGGVYDINKFNKPATVEIEGFEVDLDELKNTMEVNRHE